MSSFFFDEKEFSESIQKTRGLIEICEDFIKSSENSVKRYQNCVKQYSSNPNYTSCLEEAEEWFAESK